MSGQTKAVRGPKYAYTVMAWMKGEIFIGQECEEYRDCRRPSETGGHGVSTVGYRGQT